MSQSPDLERIMSYFHKGAETEATYVEFPSTLPKPVRPQPEPPRTRPIPAPPRPAPPPVERPVSVPPAHRPAPHFQGPALPGEWPALDEALRKGLPEGAGTEGAWTPILMTGLAGGTGKTLLLTLLATTLALRNTPVILVDLNGSSFIPFLFIGCHRVETTRVGRAWTSYFHEGRQIPLLSVRVEGPFSGDPDSGTDLTFSDLYHEIRAEAPALFPFSDAARPTILIDLAASARPVFEETVSRSRLVLSPIIPEIPSLLSVKELENYFEALETGKGIYCERFYLPNRFSGENPFHAHLLGKFQWLLNRRLCPVVVPEDPALGSFLAQGETFRRLLVQNGITHTLGPVLGWLAEKCEALNRIERSKEG
jgi:hypothetical protein